MKGDGVRTRRVYLVPYRWWTEPLTRDVGAGESVAEFGGLGGPFRKGLVLVSEPGEPSAWKPAGGYDLDKSHAVSVPADGAPPEASVPVPEAGCVPAWGLEVSEAARLFFGMLTPHALFWRTGFSAEASVLRPAGSALAGRSGGGGLRGYARSAFLPVLIESSDGGAWLEWTSAASEFELSGVPAAVYRARALNYAGTVSFARGLVVPKSGTAELMMRLGEELELDEPLSREVMGVVRWEDGRPVKGAQVFLQDATSFRRFLRKVETDRNGFFQIPNVPGDAVYFAFGLPPKDADAMKQFIYPRIESARRETWLDLNLSPHRVVGRAAVEPQTRMDLVCEDPGAASASSGRPSRTSRGGFVVSNVPHGRYVARAAGGRPRRGAPRSRSTSGATRRSWSAGPIPARGTRSRARPDNPVGVASARRASLFTRSIESPKAGLSLLEPLYEPARPYLALGLAVAGLLALARPRLSLRWLSRRGLGGAGVRALALVPF